MITNVAPPVCGYRSRHVHYLSVLELWESDPKALLEKTRMWHRMNVAIMDCFRRHERNKKKEGR